MLEVIDSRDDLLLGVVDVDVVIEPLLDDHVDVLVDRAVEDPAAVLPVVTGQVGPPAEQADAQRCLGDDHRPGPCGPLLPGSPVGVGGADIAEVPFHQHRPRPADQPGQQVDSRCRSAARRRSRRARSDGRRTCPALIRSETGLAGFSANPVTRPAASSLHDASRRRPFGVEHRQGRDRAMVPVRVDQRPQIEIREVVGVAGQEELFPVDPVPVGERAFRRCRAVPARRPCARRAARSGRRGDGVPRPAGGAG